MIGKPKKLNLFPVALSIETHEHRSTIMVNKMKGEGVGYSATLFADVPTPSHPDVPEGPPINTRVEIASASSAHSEQDAYFELIINIRRALSERKLPTDAAVTTANITSGATLGRQG